MISGLEEASSILSYFMAEDPVAAQRIDSSNFVRFKKIWCNRSGQPPSGTFALEIRQWRMKSAVWPTGTLKPPLGQNQSLGHRTGSAADSHPRSLVDDLP